MDLVFAPSEIETWPIDRLRPYARNAKMHGDDQVAKIAASMAKFGWTVPCMVADDGELIAGHGRVLAATLLGLTEVPVIRLGHLDETERRAYGIADNKLTELGEWDEATLRDEIAGLLAEDFDLTLLGITDEDLDALLQDPDALGEVGPLEGEDDVDHCSGEFIGTHASSSASRWEALEPVRQGVTRHFGGVGPDVAKGLTLRHDHGSNYMADDFQKEIGCFGILSSPAFVRQPEGNGVAERAIRTLKEQLLWVRHFETVEELRQALAAFAAEHNASWLRQRHGYKTPDQIRAEQKALEPEAATGVKMAA